MRKCPNLLDVFCLTIINLVQPYSIVNRLTTLGWGEELEHMQKNVFPRSKRLRSHALVKQPKDLTDRSVLTFVSLLVIAKSNLQCSLGENLPRSSGIFGRRQGKTPWCSARSFTPRPAPNPAKFDICIPSSRWFQWRRCHYYCRFRLLPRSSQYR